MRAHESSPHTAAATKVLTKELVPPLAVLQSTGLRVAPALHPEAAARIPLLREPTYFEKRQHGKITLERGDI